MKNIDEYIIEQEFNDNFLIEEGFLSWIAKLGKKFWNWLTSKNYKSDDLDWSLYNDKGKRLKMKWYDINNDHLTSMFNGRNGLEEQFINIIKTLKKHNKFIKHIQGRNAININKIPPIVILYTTNKKFIYSLLKGSYKNVYNKYENKIHNIQNPVMILSIEIARNNDNSIERIWDDYIYSEITNAFLDSYDIVFFDVNNINKLKKYLKDEWGISNSFPIVDGIEEWEDISDEIEDDEDDSNEDDSTKEDDSTEDDSNGGSEKAPDPDDGSVKIHPEDDKNINHTIVFFDEKKENVAESNIIIYNKKTKDIFEDILEGMPIDNKGYYNLLMTDLEISDKYSESDYRNVISDFIIPVIFEKCTHIIKEINEKESTAKQIKVYIKLDDEKYEKHIKALSALSKSKKIKESIKKIFIIIGSTTENLIAGEKKAEKTEIKESLDIDNLFWMLDTWFTNNEQECSTFMSIIDNCIIKRTYTKNDLAKICDNINFEIRPFINFLCKDAVVSDNNSEDYSIDYYYELKKVIDTLISNKATNNKYVRFS